MGRIVKKSDNILLKVNLLSVKGPEKAVTTHPEFVGAVAKAFRKAGGRPYIGDSPAGPFPKGYLKRAYRRSGLEDLAGKEEIPLSITI